MEIIKKSNKQVINSKATEVAFDMARAAGDAKLAKYEKLLEKAKVLRDSILSKYKSKALTQVKRSK